MATTGGIVAGKAYVIIGALDKTGGVLSKAGERFNRWGRQITGAGQALFTKALGLALPMGLAARQFTSFDDTMRRIEGRSEGTAAAMDALRQQALELSTAVRLSSGQIAEIQQIYAQAGFNRSEILDLAGSTAKFAIATAETNDVMQAAGIAAKLTASVMKQYNLQAKDTVRIQDALTAGINSSLGGLESFADSMTYAGPVMSAMGMTIERSTALVAALSNLGLTGSQVGTALRGMHSQLIDPAKRDKFKKNMEAMTGATVDLLDQSGGLRSLDQILNDIGEATKNLPSAQKLQVFVQLFGRWPLAGALGLARNTNLFADAMARVANSSGEVERAFNLMQSGVGGASSTIWNSIIKLTNEAIQPFAASLTNTLNAAKDFINNAVIPWIMRNRELTTALVGVTGIMGALGIGLMAIGTTVKLLAPAFFLLAAPLRLFAFGGKLLLSALSMVPAILSSIVSLASTLGAALLPLVTFPATIAGALSSVGVLLGVTAGVTAVVLVGLERISELWTSLKAVGVETANHFKEMGQMILKSWSSITDALAMGNVRQAGELAILTLRGAWVKFEIAVLSGLSKIKSAFADAFRPPAWLRAFWTGAQKGASAVYLGLNPEYQGKLERYRQTEIRRQEWVVKQWEDAMARHPGKTEEQIRALEPHLPSLDVENWIDTIATIEDVYNKNAEAAKNASGTTQKALEKELDSIRLKLVAMRGMIAVQKQYNDLVAMGKYTAANAMQQVKPWYDYLKPFFTPKKGAGAVAPSPTPPVFIPTKILDALEYSTMEGFKAAWSETGSDDLLTETKDQTEILTDIKEAIEDISVY